MTGTFLVAPGRGVDPRWYTWLADAAAEAGFTPVIADGRLRGVGLLVVAAADDRVCPPYQAALLAGSARAHGLAVHTSTIPAAGHFFERVPCLESARGGGRRGHRLARARRTGCSSCRRPVNIAAVTALFGFSSVSPDSVRT